MPIYIITALKLNSTMKDGQIFEWIKTDNIGIEEIFDFEDEVYTYFKSGRRIKTSELNSYLVNIKADSNKTTNTADEDFTAIPQPNNRSAKSSFLNSVIQQQNAVSKNQVNSSDKISEVIEETCEAQPVTFDVNLKIPDRKSYTILKKIYGEEAVNEVIKKSLESEIDKAIQEIVLNLN
jgi:hypothetical protein